MIIRIGKYWCDTGPKIENIYIYIYKAKVKSGSSILKRQVITNKHCLAGELNIFNHKTIGLCLGSWVEVRKLEDVMLQALMSHCDTIFNN